MPVSEKIPTKTAAAIEISAGPSEPSSSGMNIRPADDGTRALLQAGFWIVVGGLLSLLATETLFGGIGIHGAHTNAGWLSLMFALMAVPFGLMLLVLGGAKWLRNRRNSRQSRVL
ncbi:MAG: hypothetical protein WA708_12320 [Acidobacteriaceae bacterium]